MLYVKNVPLWERYTRVIVGLILAYVSVDSLGGVWGWLLAASFLGIVISGLIGFCPACAMVGRRLDKAEKQANK